MTALRSLADLAETHASRNRPSAELRRFSSAVRFVTAVLIAVMLLAHDETAGTGFVVIPLVLAYALWSAWLLAGEANNRARPTALWLYWVDVAWASICLLLVSGGTRMLIIAMVPPVMLASIGFGGLQGVLLALFAALGVLLDSNGDAMPGFDVSLQRSAPALLLLGLLPTVALVSKPFHKLRQRLELHGDLEEQLDPRRGLEAICTEVTERLRQSVDADVAILVLPSGESVPAMIASREDGAFRAKSDVHARLEDHLSQLPNCPVSLTHRHWWDWRPGVVMANETPAPEGVSSELGGLARTLEVQGLHVVPLNRYGHPHGHFVVGFKNARAMPDDTSTLVRAAPDLLRVIEQAATVDKLHDESVSHERARIGRDLHDSAIQPYLGLKYAVEGVALRIPPDNPARAEVDALAELVNSQVGALRELISNLRTGAGLGDNALIPALRRQCRRFTELFGIEVELDTPERVATTRVLASALFHMVNEVLNNIRKHTVAHHVWITLSVESQHLRLAVRDNAGSMHRRAYEPFYPASLSERAADLGGSVQIAESDGLNTEIVIQIPLQQEQKAAA